MRTLRLALAAAVLAAGTVGAPAAARADAASDWQAIVAMDSGMPSNMGKSREEAVEAAIDYMGGQDRALRAFLAAYPGDPHELDAELRRAHLLATRGDLEQDREGAREADAIFARIEADPKFQSRRPDIAFARLSLFMQRLSPDSAADRAVLLEKARAFAAAYPRDHRVAPLFAEVAAAFGDDPKTARGLLEQARPLADTDQLKARIDDDLKRLDLLGKPLQMSWTSIQGKMVNVAKMKGSVVLIYFFSSWSAPSMIELDWVRRLAASHEGVQVLGICLDADPVTLPSMLADHQIDWPVYCDGAGWTGPLVRSLGINALPVLWVVDGDGVLRSLDAGQNADALVARLSRERGR